MSKVNAASALERCRDAAVQTAWSQWSVLGGQVGGRYRAPASVVDPEALVLLSCTLRQHEPRLWDLVAGLAGEAPFLLSVQRTRNLAAHFPESARSTLAEVAAIAVTDGKDARWRPVAKGASPRPYRGGKVYKPSGRVVEPPALVLRLRLAFGVHARTDILAFLIATAPASASTKEVAEATGYGVMPVRRALDAIAAARLIATEGTRPERYHATAERWAPLLDLDNGTPQWRYWPMLFAFLAHAVEPVRPETVRERSRYLESGDARRLVLTHRAAFARNRIVVPEPTDYPGEAFLEGYENTLDAVAEWLGENT